MSNKSEIKLEKLDFHSQNVISRWSKMADEEVVLQMRRRNKSRL